MYDSKYNKHDGFVQLGKIAFVTSLHTDLVSGSKEMSTEQKTAYVNENVLRCAANMERERMQNAKTAEVYAAGVGNTFGNISSYLERIGQKTASEAVLKHAEEEMEAREAMLNEEANAVPVEHTPEVDEAVLEDLINGVMEQVAIEQAALDAQHGEEAPQIASTPEEAEKVAHEFVYNFLQPQE